MTSVTDEEVVAAIARGGPLDGQILGAADADSFVVLMADRSHWEYFRGEDKEITPEGTWAVVYVSRGRI